MIRKRKLSSLLVATAVFAFLLGSCMKPENFQENEEQNINGYLEKHPDIPFTKKQSGLYFYEVTAGSGNYAKAHDTAFVFYTGKFLDGYVFDTNIGKDTLKFPVGEEYVIAGFDEAMAYMQQGGKSIFIIPSNLGYGPTGFYFIPGYTPLLYEVNMVKLSPGPGSK